MLVPTGYSHRQSWQAFEPQRVSAPNDCLVPLSVNTLACAHRPHTLHNCRSQLGLPVKTELRDSRLAGERPLPTRRWLPKVLRFGRHDVMRHVGRTRASQPCAVQASPLAAVSRRARVRSCNHDKARPSCLRRSRPRQRQLLNRVRPKCQERVSCPIEQARREAGPGRRLRA